MALEKKQEHGPSVPGLPFSGVLFPRPSWGSGAEC